MQIPTFRFVMSNAREQAVELITRYYQVFNGGDR